MSVKVFIGIIVFAILAIIIGLVVLLQKQPKSVKTQEGESGLEIVGSQGAVSPSKSPIEQISPSDVPDQIGPEKPFQKITSLTQPKMTIDTTKKHSAVLKTTAGDITVSFNTKETPITVNNFFSLAKKDFYNDTIFHRVIKGFMIQGGDPNGTGMGGPGYKFDDESITGEYTEGTIAMANSGPNTNGSQFFIMHESSTSLPKNYVIFGKVTDGLDVVDKIATAPVTTSASGEPSKPIDPVSIISITITEK